MGGPKKLSLLFGQVLVTHPEEFLLLFHDIRHQCQIRRHIHCKVICHRKAVRARIESAFRLIAAEAG